MIQGIIAIGLMLLLLVGVHEGGHFLFARWNKLPIEEFAIGFGPTLFSRTSKKSGIKYMFKIFPIGGYVKFPKEEGETNALFNLEWKKRLTVLLGGVVFNLMLALIFFSISFSVLGPPLNGIVSIKANNEQVENLETFTDVIALNGEENFTYNEFVETLKEKDSVKLTIENDEGISTRVFEKKEGEYGLSLATGEMLNTDKKMTPYAAFIAPFKEMKKITVTVATGLSQIFTTKIPTDQGGGYVKTGAMAISIFDTSGVLFMYFIGYLSVVLAFFNALPIPALDGGYVLYTLIDELQKKIFKKQYLTLSLYSKASYGMLVIFLGFSGYLAILDIIKYV